MPDITRNENALWIKKKKKKISARVFEHMMKILSI